MPGSSGARAGGATPAAFFHRKPEDGAPVGTEKVWGRCRGRLSCRGQVGGAVFLPQAVQGGAPSLPAPPQVGTLRGSPPGQPEPVPGACREHKGRPAKRPARSLPTPSLCPSPLVAPAMVGRLTRIKTIIFFFSNLLALFKNGKAPVIPVPPSHLSDKTHRGANDHYSRIFCDFSLLL